MLLDLEQLALASFKRSPVSEEAFKVRVRSIHLSLSLSKGL